MNRCMFGQARYTVVLVLLTLVGAQTVEALLDDEKAKAPVQHSEIRAERFILVDSDGDERGGMIVAKNGTAELYVKGKGNDGNIDLSVKQDGAARLVLGATDGLVLLDVAVHDDKNPLIIFRDRKAARRMSLLVTDDGLVDLSMYDKNQKRRLLVGLGDDGSPRAVLRNGDEKDVVRLVAPATGHTGIDILDPKTDAMLSIQMSEDGIPDIAAFGENGAKSWSALDKTGN